MKKFWWILIGLAILLATILFIRFLTPEDTWICQNSQWQKHGNPSSEMPETPCK